MSSSADSHSTNSFWGHSESLQIKQSYYYLKVLLSSGNYVMVCLHVWGDTTYAQIQQYSLSTAMRVHQPMYNHSHYIKPHFSIYLWHLSTTLEEKT